MNNKVRRFIESNRLLKNGDKVIVALSGGADSTALLYCLISLKEELDLDIYAAHFNHGIRGAEADRDEAFAADLCRKLGVELFVGRADVPAAAEQTGESEELCGRRLRYAFLSGAADRLGGALIATAHNLNDNAETVLWNLTRGSGIGGLCGIPVRRDNIIRPLLSCSRGDIESYCASVGADYITDSTNLSDDYTRNKLRHRVIPVLSELNSNAIENISRTSELMREADGYLNKISVEELNKAKTRYGYSCGALLSLEPAVLKYAVKNLCARSGASADSLHIGLIIGAMRDGGSVELGRGFRAVCSQGVLRILSAQPDSADLCIPAAEYIRSHAEIYRVSGRDLYLLSGDAQQIVKDRKKINNLLLKHGVRYDIITPDTVVRYRRAGDTFTDPRRGVTKTLKKLMNEIKLPRELRGAVPLLADGSDILWLPLCGASARARVDLTRDGDIVLFMGDSNA